MIASRTQLELVLVQFFRSRRERADHHQDGCLYNVKPSNSPQAHVLVQTESKSLQDLHLAKPLSAMQKKCWRDLPMQKVESCDLLAQAGISRPDTKKKDDSVYLFMSVFTALVANSWRKNWVTTSFEMWKKWLKEVSAMISEHRRSRTAACGDTHEAVPWEAELADSHRTLWPSAAPQQAH